MQVIKRIARSNFLIKLRSWEYWPFGIIQLPAFAYWLWLSVRERSLLFFSACNPSILTGGMFGESKYGVLQLLPEEVRPRSCKVSHPASLDSTLALLRQKGFSYPFILKPDIGERGRMVRRIENETQLRQYLEEINCDFIVQELIRLPLEFGVFFARHPLSDQGVVTSITMKEMLNVVGDGTSTLRELILNKDRAKLQWAALRVAFASRLSEVIPAGERVELVPIGNHCLGTTFLNGNHLITPKLNETFNRISRQVEGFYFGRYDLRTASLEDLAEGRIKVMELNGCGAEPSHIYQPGASFRAAVKEILKHWRLIYEISRANHRMGVPYLSFREGWKIFRRFRTISAGG